MDIFDSNKRSWIMSRIRSKNTKPELIVRSMLHKMGYRFRIHRKDLPGSPDIVLPKHNTVIFVNGCFWHRHTGCKFAYEPKSKLSFWKKKFSDTIRRDNEAQTELIELGWRVTTIWECETKDIDRLFSKISSIFNSV